MGAIVFLQVDSPPGKWRHICPSFTWDEGCIVLELLFHCVWVLSLLLVLEFCLVCHGSCVLCVLVCALVTGRVSHYVIDYRDLHLALFVTSFNDSMWQWVTLSTIIYCKSWTINEWRCKNAIVPSLQLKVFSSFSLSLEDKRGPQAVPMVTKWWDVKGSQVCCLTDAVIPLCWVSRIEFAKNK